MVEAFVGEEIQLWASKPFFGERPVPVKEAFFESLGIVVRAEEKRLRVFDKEGNEILSPKEALERERTQRKELERKVAELELRLQERGQG